MLNEKENKSPIRYEKRDGLHYVNERQCCFDKNSLEDDTMNDRTFL